MTRFLALFLFTPFCSDPVSEEPANPTDLPSVEDAAPLLSGLGDFSYPVSTTDPKAQRFFDQGVTLAWAFDHAEARRSFEYAARLDPKCAMCFWGVALVTGPNINMPMSEEGVPVAWQAMQRAARLVSNVKPKERALIRALSTRYVPTPVEDRSNLDTAYANAMRLVRQAFPEDLVVAQLALEAEMDLHPWDYWEPNGTPKPWTGKLLEGLEAILSRDPKAIGANHLYIHAMEASQHPEKALPSALVLPTLAPGASHLVHMPGHIFIRVGRYKDASDANRAALKVDDGYITQCRAQGIFPLLYHPHNWHFLWVTSSLEGRREEAIRAASMVKEKTHVDHMRMKSFEYMQHYIVTPYYAFVRFGEWDKALAEPQPPPDLLYPTAVWHFMRGMAHIARGETDKADSEREQLRALRTNKAELERVALWDLNSAYHLTGIAEQLLGAEIAARKQEYPLAIELLRAAAAAEDQLFYNEPPDWPIPLRHHLGAVLLEAGHASEAERTYREDLDEFPENGWALFGLAQSLRAQGRRSDAEAAKKRFEAAWARADIELENTREVAVSTPHRP